MLHGKMNVAIGASVCAAMLVILSMGVTVLDGTVCNAPSGFTKISTVLDLGKIRTNPSSSYFLCKDIDLAGSQWEPLPHFSGTFEGNKKTIKNLSVNNTEAENVGLFSINDGTIRNLTISNPRLFANGSVGAFCGRNGPSGSLKNCHVTGVGQIVNEGTILGQAGILTGDNQSVIENSSASGDIRVRAAEDAGGIAGRSRGRISSSKVYGDIKIEAGSGDDYPTLGGIVGFLAAKAENDTGLIENSVVKGNVRLGGRGPYMFLGGIAGYSLGSIRNSSVQEKVAFLGCQSVGGIAGRLEGFNTVAEIRNSFVAETVSFNSCPPFGGQVMGGLVAELSFKAAIVDSKSHADILGNNRIGGLVGATYGDKNYASPSVKNSYATGIISGSSSDFGGLIGFFYSGHLSNSYFSGTILDGTRHGEVESGLVGNGLLNRQGVIESSFYLRRNGNDADHSARSQEQLQTSSTFANWSISDHNDSDQTNWKLPAPHGTSLPRLSWESSSSAVQ